jgi:hypothetical protein
MRAAMSDADFWAHVYPQTLPAGWDDSPSAIDLEDMAQLSHLGSPCPECGQAGACAYDAEGRALIHVTTEDDR